MNKKVILIFIFALFFLSFVSSENYKQGQVIDLKISCSYINCSNANKITISDPNSTILVDNQTLTILNGYGHYTFSSTNNSGNYQYFTYDTNNGYYSNYFSITPNGEDATTGKAVFYIGLLFVLLFFFGVSIFFFSDTDNLLTRVGSLGFAYLLLISITFIAWNMAKDFLTSSPFLIEMMRIVFFILLAGAFPLLVGMFAYYLILVFKIKEIQRLMDKGIGYDEAKKRAGEGGKYR